MTTTRRFRPRAGRNPPRSLLRPPGGSVRVTNVELYFDLVFVFAVTQLSTYLVRHPDATGALRGALLLVMVWLLWVYTTWVTNWLDPDRIPVRLMLLALALGSLVISAALPGAFGGRGLAVGIAYAVMQIGRSIFAVAALRGYRLQRNFQRILAWCLVSGGLAVAGGLVTGSARAALWVAAVGVDVLGGVAGFYTPGLGRSHTRDWAIEGNHFAERCQAFILIALGESIVVVGAALSGLGSVSVREIGAFLAAFGSSVALWWLYFDRSAEEGARVLATSDDPGRLGRSAYHLIHPFMVAGIIVVAAGDKVALTNPAAVGRAPVAWMLLGGSALFLAGHAAFRAVLWHRVPWAKLGGLVLIGLLGLVAPHVSALVLSACAAAVLLAVAVVDSVSPVAAGVRKPAASAGQPGASAGEPAA
ncbi:MAG: low temperature requirement protein A [Streptosporangiaceae bacterium]